MMPNIVTGGDTGGLMRYLVGPGRANEHARPHLIAGDDMAMQKWAHWETLSTAQATEIAAFVDRNMHTFNVYPTGTADRYDPQTGKTVSVSGVPNHVFHCSISLSPEEGPLDDETWNKIAWDFMDEMGFTGTGGKAPCRWVAVHHGGAKNGGDHIHIAANIVRGDGTKWSSWYSQRRSQRACNMLERKYGLTVLESREHERGARYDSPAALNHAKAAGADRTDRQILETRLRAAATASENEKEFIDNVRALGVRLRPRFAKGTTDHVVGYTAALHTTEAQTSKWMAGGKISRDLTLTNLRATWGQHNDPDAALESWRDAWRGEYTQRTHADLSAGEIRVRNHALDVFNTHLASIDPTDPQQLADATHDIAGLLACAAEKEGLDTRERRVIERCARRVGAHSQRHHQPYAPRVRHHGVNSAARMLLHTRRRNDPAREVARTMVTFVRLTQTLASLYRAANQYHTARMLTRDTASLMAMTHRNYSTAATVTHTRPQSPVLATMAKPVTHTQAPVAAAAMNTHDPALSNADSSRAEESASRDPLSVTRRLLSASNPLRPRKSDDGEKPENTRTTRLNQHQKNMRGGPRL